MQRQDLGVCIPVSLESNTVTHRLQCLFAVLSKIIEYQRIAVAVTHENRRVFVDIAFGDAFLELLVQKKPRR